MDLLQQATEAAAAKRLARLAELSKKSLSPLPTWDAGYDSSGRRLVQTLGQDPVAVGRPVSTGAIGTGDRTYNTGSAVDVIPHIKPTPVVPVKKQEDGLVKILFSATEGGERVFYVGGDRRTPKELFRNPNPLIGSFHLVTTGPGLNDFFWQGLGPTFLVDSRYPDPISIGSITTSFFSAFPGKNGDGSWNFSLSGDVSVFYRNGEIFPRTEVPPNYYYRVWLDGLNTTDFFISYGIPGDPPNSLRIPLVTQAGYSLVFTPHGLPFVVDDGTGRFATLSSQNSSGTIVLIDDTGEIPSSGTGDLYKLWAAAVLNLGNTITKKGVFHTVEYSEYLTIDGSTTSIEFLNADLRSGAVSRKRIKIFPLGSGANAIYEIRVAR